MAETTGISWTDHTFNSWIGCTKVSTGPLGACELCYAESLADTRHGWAKWGNHPRHRTSAAYWRQPLAWDRKAAAAGEPRFVFCCSLADVFDNQVDPEWRRDLFDLIEATPHLTWLLLTKRPQNIVKLFGETLALRRLVLQPSGAAAFWPRNAAIGCTVVTQDEVARDVPVLLEAKRRLRPAFAFVSMEPLMGAASLVDFDISGDSMMDALTPHLWCDEIEQWRGTSDTWEDDLVDWFNLPEMPDPNKAVHPTLDWVITGGETDQGGKRARPSDTAWFRSLRDQCAAAGVPFHFKQMPRKAPIPPDLQIQERPDPHRIAEHG